MNILKFKLKNTKYVHWSYLMSIIKLFIEFCKLENMHVLISQNSISFKFFLYAIECVDLDELV